MPSSSSTKTGRIGLLKPRPGGPADFSFVFAVDRSGVVNNLAPNSIERTRSATYVAVPVALSDHTPDEWKANNPTDITISFEIVGTRQISVDSELRKLRKFMSKKSGDNGEPPDLVFVLGSKSWKVRIHRMTEKPTLWNDDANEQRVKVSVTMRTIDLED